MSLVRLIPSWGFVGGVWFGYCSSSFRIWRLLAGNDFTLHGESSRAWLGSTFDKQGHLAQGGRLPW